ncbi:hypothetical protein HYU21_03355 [Candidatus Woesearchaeota archaeon]|nr:hypothetical protein [Candidatus Woesearchaeota archaeon]
MVTSRLFRDLTKYFYDDVNTLMTPVKDGHFYNPITNEAIQEGEENPFAKGLLIIKNGSTTIDELVRNQWLKPSCYDHNFTPISGCENLFSYLNQNSRKDGVYILDEENQRITRVYELDNNVHTPKDKDMNKEKGLCLLEHLPEDFLGQIKLSLGDIGTKTRLAIRIPQLLDHVETYQIKRTANETGFGSVTHFNENGLVERLFLRYDPQSAGPFFNEEKKLIGVYQTFRNPDSQVVLESGSVYNHPMLQNGSAQRKAA